MPLPDPGNSGAVLVGVAEFGEDPSLPPIPAVCGNLMDLSAAITSPQLLGLPSGQCHVILNPPTPQDITRPLIRLAEDVSDTLIIYYAGHGLIDEFDSTLILAAGRTASRDARFSGLPYELFRNAIGHARAKRTIVILDCCFSGRAITAMGDADSVIIGQLDIEGSYILASSPANKPSIAPVGARHTAFTGCLLDILNKGVPGSSQFLRLSEIYQRLLPAMIKAGYPLPRQRTVNSIESLEFVRNAAWRSRPSLPVTPKGQAHALLPVLRMASAGASQAADVVSPALGLGGGGAVAALAEVQVADPVHGLGFRMMCELASSMHRQFGDGAATAVIMAARLMAGLRDAVAGGSDPAMLSAALERSVDQACDYLRDLAWPCTDLIPPLRAAFGHSEVVNLIASAAGSVGATNVETVENSGRSANIEITSRVTINTRIISPNAIATPVNLVDPYIVASPDMVLDVKSLVTISNRPLPALLLITPHRTVKGMRAILHSFKRIVVVQAVAAREWDHLAAVLEVLLGRPPLAGTAMRALISDSSTTIVGRGDLRVGDTGRGQVFVGRELDNQPELARRALLVARAADTGGLLAGGGTALDQVGRAFAAAGGEDERVTAILRAAVSEPLRQLARNAGRDPDAVSAELAALPGDYGLELPSGCVADLGGRNIVDPLPVVQGALRHALAIVVSLASGEGPAT